MFQIFFIVILISACKQKTNESEIQEYVVKEFTKYSDSIFIIKELDMYKFPDTLIHDSSYYFHYKLIIFKNVKENYSDTIFDHYNDIIEYISEISGKLELDYPIFCFKNIGGSDIVTKEYYNVIQKKINKLFDIESNIDLKRYNDSLLTGYIIERDTLLFHFQKYKIYVNLNTYEKEVLYPIRNYIDFETNTLNEILIYEDIKLSKKFKLKENENIYIDSAYYDLRVLKIIYKNKPYYISFDSIQNNIQINAAG